MYSIQTYTSCSTLSCACLMMKKLFSSPYFAEFILKCHQINELNKVIILFSLHVLLVMYLRLYFSYMVMTTSQNRITNKGA